jgi:hypothetical protein
MKNTRNKQFDKIVLRVMLYLLFPALTLFAEDAAEGRHIDLRAKYEQYDAAKLLFYMEYSMKDTYPAVLINSIEETETLKSNLAGKVVECVKCGYTGFIVFTILNTGKEAEPIYFNLDCKQIDTEKGCLIISEEMGTLMTKYKPLAVEHSK